MLQLRKTKIIILFLWKNEFAQFLYVKIFIFCFHIFFQFSNAELT